MLLLAVATFQAVERIGLPEGRLTLAHATAALSKAPKSRATTNAIGAAAASVRDHPAAQVPLHLQQRPNQAHEASWITIKITTGRPASSIPKASCLRVWSTRNS